MASIAKIFSTFILLSLLFSLQTHARDSQFFSKVTRENANTNNNDNNYFNTNTDVQKQASKVTKEQEQEPAFIPQTTQTSYGLYGHETGQFPPSTTTTTTTNEQPSYTTTYKTQFEKPINNAYGTNNFNNFNNNNKENKFMYNMDAFESKEEGNTKETQNGYYHNTKINANSKNNSPELQGLSGTSYQNANKYNYNYNKNVEKQGMSDTRFLENGRYFYDVYTENNVPKFGYQNSARNEYLNNNNNVNGGYYGNNGNFNSNQYRNGMQGFENQEDEFEFEP